MIVRERRFDVRLISASALAQYMKYRDLSVRELADKVGCSRATIGHLRSGHRTYIRPDWAKAIEKCLDAPRGSLFVAEVSTVTREIARKVPA
ncbi:helix-turn-helix domain-containing protein [Ruania rhizosphaerae]|uniref:helix-turn-helix domain-containing protein n=1 Tax=Ruania rhizosphaerae TaxID=1840413 RepID=UPI00135BE856|nr:helix-turn-helix transcriptional regulator [Ruania rhizosphaerae]